MRFVLRLPSLKQLRRDSMLPAILVSVGLHLGIVALGVAAVSWGQDVPVPLPVYTVSLVDLPQSGPPAAGGPAPALPAQEEPSPPPPEPEPEPEPEIQAVPEIPPEKKPEPAKKKPPAPKPQPPAAQPRPQPSTPSTDTAPETDLPAAAGGEGEAADIGLASSGTGSVDGVPTIDSDAFGFGYYRDILTNRLRSTWSRPLVPGGLQQPIRATVIFVVLRSGALTDISIQDSSGYPPLDRSALRSVFDANPLPPLPDPYEGDRLAVTFFFELTPER